MSKLLAILLGLILLTAPFVRADGDGGSSSGSNEEGDESDELDRNLSIETNSNNTIVIRSERKIDGAGEEKLKFEVSVAVDLEITLRYENSSGEAEFSVHFRDLIYYAENNSSPGYQAGEAVSDTPFSNMTWNRLQVNQTANGYDVTASTQDGSFSVVCHLVTTTADSIRPTSVKFDVNIQKTSANFVALVVRTESDSDQREDGESDEQKDGFTSQSENQVSFSSSAFFSWVEAASINLQNVGVLNSPLTTDSGDKSNNQRITFSFPTAEVGLLTWDPKIGAKSSNSGVMAQARGLFILALIAFLLLLA